MKLLNDWREACKLIDNAIDPAFSWIAQGAFLAGIGSAGLMQLLLGLPPLWLCLITLPAGLIVEAWGVCKLARAAIAKAEGRAE